MSDTDRRSDQPQPVSDDAFAAEPSDRHGGDRTADEWLLEPSLGSETADAPAAATGSETADAPAAATGSDEPDPDGSSDADAVSTWGTESPAWGSGTPTRDSSAAPVARAPEGSPPDAPADPWRGGEVAGTGPAADTPAAASTSWSPEEPRHWGWSAEDEPASPATAKDWSPAIPPGWPGDPPPGSWTPEPGSFRSTGEDDQGRWSGGSWAEPSSTEAAMGQVAGAPPDSDIGTADFEADLSEAAASAAPEPAGPPAETLGSGSVADERAAPWPAVDRARDSAEAAEPAASTEPADGIGSAMGQDVERAAFTELAADVAEAAPAPAAEASPTDEEIEAAAEAAPVGGAPADETHEAIEPAAEAAPVGGAHADDDADEVIQPAAEAMSGEDGGIDGADTDDTIEPAALAASVAEGDVDRVERPGPVSDDAQVSRTGFDLIKADRVELSQGGANRIEGREVHITQGGAGRVNADQVSISMGGIGIAQARQVTLEADSNAFVVIANEARVQEGGRVLVLLARSVSGDVRAVLDWRSVAAVVAVLGVLGLLTRRMRGR